MSKLNYLQALASDILTTPFNSGVRQLIADQVGPYSKVLDIGCGTGALALKLIEEGNCNVHGIDLSPAKIERAKRKLPERIFEKARFSCTDATDLHWIPNDSFDYVTMSLVLHAVPHSIRTAILHEASRLAPRIVIADFATPLPQNPITTCIEFSEWRAGQEHWKNFQDYQQRGGLEPIVQEADLKIKGKVLSATGTVRVVNVK